MRDGVLDMEAPIFSGSLHPTNFELASGGLTLNVAMDFSWAAIEELCLYIHSSSPSLLWVTPGATGTVYTGGNLEVGLPNGFGAGSLSVRDAITSGGHSVPRWMGRLSADPSLKNGGDTYWNTTTNKARLWNGTGWVDLN